MTSHNSHILNTLHELNQHVWHFCTQLVYKNVAHNFFHINCVPFWCLSSLCTPPKKEAQDVKLGLKEGYPQKHLPNHLHTQYYCSILHQMSFSTIQTYCPLQWQTYVFVSESTTKKREQMWTFKSAEYKLTEHWYHWQLFSFNSVENQVTYKHYNICTNILPSVHVQKTAL